MLVRQLSSSTFDAQRKSQGLQLEGFFTSGYFGLNFFVNIVPNFPVVVKIQIDIDQSLKTLSLVERRANQLITLFNVL